MVKDWHLPLSTNGKLWYLSSERPYLWQQITFIGYGTLQWSHVGDDEEMQKTSTAVALILLQTDLIFKVITWRWWIHHHLQCQCLEWNQNKPISKLGCYLDAKSRWYMMKIWLWFWNLKIYCSEYLRHYELLHAWMQNLMLCSICNSYFWSCLMVHVILSLIWCADLARQGRLVSFRYAYDTIHVLHTKVYYCVK